MTADSLAAFLTRMYDEIAALAETAAATPWTGGTGHWSVVNIDYEGINVGAPDGWVTKDGGITRDAVTAHMEANDPAYVLADIEAKRRIVAWHTNDHDLLHSSRPTVGCRCYDGWPCTTLRLLAQPFAGHPDFRPEWQTANR